jgi:acetoacetyl-CoA synthetase
MANDMSLTEQLKSQIKITLRQRVSPRHVPNQIYQIEDIPYTNSGKKVELAVKQVINKETVSFNLIRTSLKFHV